MDDVQQQQMMQNYNAMQYQMNNQGFNSASALQIRIDTDPLIERFQIYLRGKDIRTVMDEEGNSKQVILWSGSPIVNDNGYQAVMSWITLIYSTHVIQGNFLDEQYFGTYLMNLRKDFFLDMMKNRHEYNIPIKEIEALSAKFCNCAYMLLTRPLFNKEREGMNNTTKTVESMQTNPGQGWSIPFFGGKK